MANRRNKDMPEGYEDMPEGYEDVPEGYEDVPEGYGDPVPIEVDNRRTRRAGKFVRTDIVDMPEGYGDPIDTDIDNRRTRRATQAAENITMYETPEADPDVPEGYEPVSQIDEKVPRTFQVLGGALEGLVENTAGLAGNFLQATNLITGGNIPSAGFVWEGDNLLPTYKSMAEYDPKDSALNRGAKALQNISLKKQDAKTYQDVKDAFSEGGPFSTSAFADVIDFAFTQGVSSVPEMIAAFYAAPYYVLAKSASIGDINAKNRGKEEAELVDMLRAAPFAIGTMMTDRYGAQVIGNATRTILGKNMMKAGIENLAKKQALATVAKEGGKAAAVEAATEAVQEGMIEYVGERIGSDVAMDLNEALDRAAGGALAGGLFGGAVTVGSGVAANTSTALGNIQSKIAEAPDVDSAIDEAAVVLNREVEISRERTRARETALKAKSLNAMLDEQGQVDELTVKTLTPEQTTTPHIKTDLVETQEAMVFDEDSDYLKDQEDIDAYLIDDVPEGYGPITEEVQPEEVSKIPPKKSELAAEAARREGTDDFKLDEPQATEDALVTKPKEEPSAAVPSKEEVRIPEKVGIEPETEIPRAEEVRSTEALVSELKLSKDVPQIKTGADAKGVVEPLGGKFDPTGVGPIQVWVRKNGDQEVISGRHRLDLAQRSGTKYISVQKHFESEGFTLQDAKSLDAILNIREGQGQVKDYVDFIKSNKMTEAQAEAEGILARNTGKQAFTVATKGSDLLIDTHAQGTISDNAATKIANAAPNNESLQAVGLKALADGKSITVAENMVRAVSTFDIPQQQQESGDLFGFDDAALVEAETIAKAASAKQALVQKTLSAIQGAAKDPKRAAKEGVDVKDPVAVQKRIAELKAEKAKWVNWQSDPKLVAELKKDIAGEQEADMFKAEEDVRGLEKLEAETLSVVKATEPKPEPKPKAKAKAKVKPAEPAAKPKAKVTANYELYESTLAEGDKGTQKGYKDFLEGMREKFGDAAKLSPKGTITNRKDFTQFIKSQLGQDVPLEDIKLTRKVKDKDGKLKVAQVKAASVLRQTRKKREVALRILRCAHGK